MGSIWALPQGSGFHYSLPPSVGELKQLACVERSRNVQSLTQNQNSHFTLRTIYLVKDN